MSDTEPEQLRPVLDAIDKVEHAMEAEALAIRGALSSLRTTVLDHYHAIQSRVDGHARRLQRLEDELKLPPMPPEE